MHPSAEHGISETFLYIGCWLRNFEIVQRNIFVLKVCNNERKQQLSPYWMIHMTILHQSFMQMVSTEQCWLPFLAV